MIILNNDLIKPFLALTVPSGTTWGVALKNIFDKVIELHNNGAGVARSKFVVEINTTTFYLTKYRSTNIIFSAMGEIYAIRTLSCKATAIDSTFNSLEFNNNTSTWSLIQVPSDDIIEQEIKLYY